MVSWWVVALAILVVAAIAVSLVIAGRRMRRGSVRRQPRFSDQARPDGRIVSAAIVVGWIVVVWVAGTTIYQAIGIAFGGWPVVVLTEPFWPRIPPSHLFYGDGASLVTNGGYTEANAVIPDLSVAARIWDIIAVVIQGAAIVVVGLVVIRLCRNLRGGLGLRGAGRMFGTLSIAALVGGFGWEIARQIGGTLAAHQVDLGGSGNYPDQGDFTWPIAAGSVNVDFWPVLPFLAFGALAAAFRYAERLQKDTEGLV